MTPEPRRLVAERARSLQLRLNHGRVDPITAATEGRCIFTDAGESARVRWLRLEFDGYGDLAGGSHPLHRVLGVAPDNRLVAHVLAYRTQRGREEGDGEFRHFFVESLSDLVSASARVATLTGTPEVELEFAPSDRAPNHPRLGTFRRDVFERVIAGFIAALHLQLGTVP